MVVFKCKMCGGDLHPDTGSTTCECEFCGTVQTVPTDDGEKKTNLFNRANRLRMNAEFDKAAAVYESIAAEFPEEAEAYWGLCLCAYGIEYVDDPATGEKKPTCHRTLPTSIMEDSNFVQACDYADAIARRVYREEAKAIDLIQKDILSIVSNEAPYDVFICYKETADEGGRTEDSVLAQEIYDALIGKGLKVFFSRITLEDKLGQQYEPYIYAALSSAKVMLAIGTKFEYYDAVWVKNEWMRFLSMMKTEKGKTLIPCYKGIDAYDMPKEFKNLQGQDMSKLGWLQDLVRGVEKIVDKKTEITGKASDNAGSALTKRGYLYLEDSDYGKSMEYFEKALDENPEDGKAYLGKVFSKLKIHSLEELETVQYALDSDSDFHKAIRFSSGGESARLKSILESNTKRIGTNKDLIKKIIAATPKEFLALMPMLKQLTSGIDAAETEKTFGVSKAVIDEYLLKYEIYTVLLNSKKPLNTKEIKQANATFTNVSIDQMRKMLVDLNHAGLIAFENKHFYAITDEYRASKTKEQQGYLNSQVEENEKTIAKLDDAISLISKEIEQSSVRITEAKEKAVQQRALAEAEIEKIDHEIQEETNKTNSIIAADEAEQKSLSEQINALNKELAGLNLFQGKRKKEINDQLAQLTRRRTAVQQNIRDKKSELESYITSRQTRKKELSTCGKEVDELEATLNKQKNELQSLTNQRETAKQALVESKRKMESYEWKPELIQNDYDDNDYLFMMPIDDVFSITGRGTVVTGCVSYGQISLSDAVTIIHADGSAIETVVTGIEMFHKLLDTAKAGDNVGLLCRGLAKGQVFKGDIMIKPSK